MFTCMKAYLYQSCSTILFKGHSIVHTLFSPFLHIMDPAKEDAIYNERFVRIICIGAGASGICLAYKLKRSFSNFSLTVKYPPFTKRMGLVTHHFSRSTIKTQRLEGPGMKIAIPDVRAMFLLTTTLIPSIPSQTGHPSILVLKR